MLDVIGFGGTGLLNTRFLFVDESPFPVSDAFFFETTGASVGISSSDTYF